MVTRTLAPANRIQSLLLDVYEPLVIFQHRGKLFFLDFHSFFIKVDVPPLLNQGADGDEIVSDVDTFFQRIDLRDLLVELRVFGIHVMQRGRILVSGRLEHIGARSVACDHVGLPFN